MLALWLRFQIWRQQRLLARLRLVIETEAILRAQAVIHRTPHAAMLDGDLYERAEEYHREAQRLRAEFLRVQAMIERQIGRES